MEHEWERSIVLHLNHRVAVGRLQRRASVKPADAGLSRPALTILGQRSAHSLATGPVMALPFISPLGFTITPALSSKYRKIPSRLRHGLR